MGKKSIEIVKHAIYYCEHCHASESLEDARCPNCGADVSEIMEDITEQGELKRS